LYQLGQNDSANILQVEFQLNFAKKYVNVFLRDS